MNPYDKAGIGIIPVVTKVDLPNAAVDDTILQLATTFSMEPDDVIATSAKAGIGIDAMLDAIVAVS
jgi:GTP-binding protein LepA